MRPAFLLLWLIVSCAPAWAESWVPTREAGIPGEYLVDVCTLPDGLHGWTICGPDLWRTEDGWRTWERITVPDLSGMYGFTAVTFLDAAQGWAVSAGGKVLRSRDGGRTWTLSHQAAHWLNDIFFLDPLHGWAVGELVVLRTVDGGESWIEQSCPWIGNKVVFRDRLHGWAAGTFILVTSDGGETWSVQHSGESLNAIAFADSLRGCAVGGWGSPPQERVVCFTTDGGAHWTSSVGSPPGLRDVALDASGAGFAVGDNGTVLATSNAGRDWAPDSSAQRNNLLAVCLASDRAWATGWDGTLTEREFPGPGPWMELVPPCNLLHAVAWGDSLHATAVGDWGIVLQSGDGGATWGERWVAEDSTMVQLTTVAMAGPDRIWVSGPLTPGVLRSLDAGATWQAFPLADAAGARALAMGDSLHGWCIPLNPLSGDRVYHSADGGTSWQAQVAAGPRYWSAVCALDSLHAWVGGKDTTLAVGVVLRTADGGAHWAMHELPTAEAVTALAFRDTTTGWVATGGGTSPTDTHGTLYLTTNGCGAWTQVDEVDGGFFGLAVLDEVGAAVSGFAGTYPHKTGIVDRSEGPAWPWLRDYSSPEEESAYWALGFGSRSHGCAVGDRGGILRWTGTVDVAKPEAVRPGPRLRVLHNPARGSVSFEWQAPGPVVPGTATPVQIEILDVAGARVRTLRGQSNAPAPARLTWDGRREDGAEASPGVYFARARGAGGEVAARFVRLR